MQQASHRPHIITSNLEHDSIKLVLEHFHEAQLAGELTNLELVLKLYKSMLLMMSKAVSELNDGCCQYLLINY